METRTGIALCTRNVASYSKTSMLLEEEEDVGPMGEKYFLVCLPGI